MLIERLRRWPKSEPELDHHILLVMLLHHIRDIDEGWLYQGG